MGAVGKAMEIIGKGIISPFKHLLGVGVGPTAQYIPQHRPDHQLLHLKEQEKMVKEVWEKAKKETQEQSKIHKKRMEEQRKRQQEVEDNLIKRQEEMKQKMMQQREEFLKQQMEQQQAHQIKIQQQLEEDEARKVQYRQENAAKQKEMDAMVEKLREAKLNGEREQADRLRKQQEEHQKAILQLQQQEQKKAAEFAKQMEEDRKRIEEERKRVEEKRSRLEREREQKEKANQAAHQAILEKERKRGEELAKQTRKIKEESLELQKKFEKNIEILRQEIKDQQDFVNKEWPIPGFMKVPVPGGKGNWCNLAITGRSGNGKSSLCNKLFGKHKYSDIHFEIGSIGETTMEPFPLDLPIPGLPERAVIGYDLPGAGTKTFPLHGVRDPADPNHCPPYVKRFGCRWMDYVIIVTNDRFAEEEVELVKECTKYNTPYVLCISKIDNTIQNVQCGGDTRMSSDMTADQIIKACKRRVRDDLNKSMVETQNEQGDRIQVPASNLCLGIFCVQCLNVQDPNSPFDVRTKYEYPQMMICLFQSVAKVRGQSEKILGFSLPKLKELMEQENQLLNADFQRAKRAHKRGNIELNTNDDVPVGSKRKQRAPEEDLGVFKKVSNDASDFLKELKSKFS